MPAVSLTSTTTLETSPSTVLEQQLSLFKFYFDQAVQEGMTYGNELYRLAKRFKTEKRLEAYRFGCELIGQGVPTIISVSQQYYSVWMSLRNPLAAGFRP